MGWPSSTSTATNMPVVVCSVTTMPSTSVTTPMIGLVQVGAPARTPENLPGALFRSVLESGACREIGMYVVAMDTGVLVQALLGGLAEGAFLGLVALGFSLVAGTVRVVHFAHGDISVAAIFAR